jgi:hypothetical protein
MLSLQQSLPIITDTERCTPPSQKRSPASHAITDADDTKAESTFSFIPFFAKAHYLPFVSFNLSFQFPSTFYVYTCSGEVTHLLAKPLVPSNTTDRIYIGFN